MTDKVAKIIAKLTMDLSFTKSVRSLPARADRGGTIFICCLFAMRSV